jgi:hypothetical protein
MPHDHQKANLSPNLLSCWTPRPIYNGRSIIEFHRRLSSGDFVSLVSLSNQGHYPTALFFVDYATSPITIDQKPQSYPPEDEDGCCFTGLDSENAQSFARICYFRSIHLLPVRDDLLLIQADLRPKSLSARSICFLKSTLQFNSAKWICCQNGEAEHYLPCLFCRDTTQEFFGEEHGFFFNKLQRHREPTKLSPYRRKSSSKPAHMG